MQPAAASIVFVPVCPHTLSFRPLVFADSTELIIEVPTDARTSAWASFDGRHSTELRRGDCVVVRSSPWPLPLLCRRSATGDWIRAIKSKLFWNMRSAVQKPFKSVTTASSGNGNNGSQRNLQQGAGGGGGQQSLSPLAYGQAPNNQQQATPRIAAPAPAVQPSPLSSPPRAPVPVATAATAAVVAAAPPSVPSVPQQLLPALLLPGQQHALLHQQQQQHPFVTRQLSIQSDDAEGDLVDVVDKLIVDGVLSPTSHLSSADGDHDMGDADNAADAGAGGGGTGGAPSAVRRSSVDDDVSGSGSNTDNDDDDDGASDTSGEDDDGAGAASDGIGRYTGGQSGLAYALAPPMPPSMPQRSHPQHQQHHQSQQDRLAGTGIGSGAAASVHLRPPPAADGAAAGTSNSAPSSGASVTQRHHVHHSQPHMVAYAPTSRDRHQSQHAHTHADKQASQADLDADIQAHDDLMRQCRVAAHGRSISPAPAHLPARLMTHGAMATAGGSAAAAGHGAGIAAGAAGPASAHPHYNHLPGAGLHFRR